MRYREETHLLVHCVRTACCLVLLALIIWLPTSMQAYAQQRKSGTLTALAGESTGKKSTIGSNTVQSTHSIPSNPDAVQGIAAHVSAGNAESGMSIYHAPSLNAQQIDSILKAGESPAYGTGSEFYADSLKSGIDSAVVLSFFRHESSLGTAGEARATHSVSNARPRTGYAEDCNTGDGCYASYPSWSAGVDDMYLLLQQYKQWFGATTIEQIVVRWAPPTDNNNDSAYIQSVESAVTMWRSQYAH